MPVRFHAFALAWMVAVLSPPVHAQPEGIERLGSRRMGEDWPQFLGPRRDGTSAETGILTDWSPGRIRLAWQFPLGESYAMGVTAYGRYFQFDRVDGQGTLWCLNAETGEILWKYAYPYAYTDLYGYNSGPRCSPLVDENRVYLFGVDGTLHCVDVSDGHLVWKVDTSERFGVVQNFFGVASSPVVYGDLLLVMVGGSPPESQQVPPGQLDQVVPNGSAVVAFDKRTGQVRYQVGDDLASYAALKVVRHAGRDWCLAFLREGLLAFEPASGQIDFHYPWRADRLESVNAMTPVVHGGQVFLSETYGPGSSLLALKAGGVEVVWRDAQRSRRKAMQVHWSTPIYHEGYLYGCSGRYSSTSDLRCIDWKTGELQWSHRGLGLCGLLLVDGHLICLSEDGTLRLIRARPDRYEPIGQMQPKDPATGRPLLQYPAWAPPILSHGLLYARGGDRVICLDLAGPQRGPADAVPAGDVPAGDVSARGASAGGASAGQASAGGVSAEAAQGAGRH